MEKQRLSSSFRDPSGYVYEEDGILYRQVNAEYFPHYRKLMDSGLYQALVDRNLLVAHDELESSLRDSEVLILRPERIPLISYPYEWSFSQYQDAALATLEVQALALEHGMTLKDASSFNIQFLRGKPVLIDTLSFETYEEGSPWIAYRQFCMHFLAPLALMAYGDVRLHALLRPFVDGVPLQIASRLLPKRTYFVPSLLTHIHIHAKTEGKYSDSGASTKTVNVRRIALLGILDSLKSGVKRLKWTPAGTEWADYYNNTNYSDSAFEAKKQILLSLVNAVEAPFRQAWDMGANTGVFSEILAQKFETVASLDVDPAAVEMHYKKLKLQPNDKLIPLVTDLSNPAPSLGFAHNERNSLTERGPVDLCTALALIHHLAIGNNVPFTQVAQWFAQMCRNLIIEFVPKEDSKVEILLKSRKDIFPRYNEEGFKEDFSKYFSITKEIAIPDSKRTVYLMKSKLLFKS